MPAFYSDGGADFELAFLDIPEMDGGTYSWRKSTNKALLLLVVKSRKRSTDAGKRDEKDVLPLS